MTKIKIIVEAEYDENKTYIIPEHVEKVFVDGKFQNVKVRIEPREDKENE